MFGFDNINSNLTSQVLKHKYRKYITDNNEIQRVIAVIHTATIQKSEFGVICKSIASSFSTNDIFFIFSEKPSER